MDKTIACLGLCSLLACADDGGSTSAGSSSMSAGSESGNTTMVSSTMTTEPASTGSTAPATESTTAPESTSTAMGSDATSLTEGMSSSSSGSGTTVADSSSGSGSDSTTAALCSGEDEPCPGGKTECCAGLDCCSGNPIPPGAEYCTAGICPISDRNKKENFAAIDPAAVLAKVAALEITTWNYTFDDEAARHLGPMAQDFAAAFALGSTDTSIFTVDADGVALASIQALHAEVVTLRDDKARLEARVARLESRLNALAE